MVNELMASLIEMGLLNEERFARSFARGHFRMKQWGREKIKNQLRLKKISDYCIRKAMTEIDDQEYMKILVRLAERKLKDVRADRSVFSRKGKMYRYLVQKGYERDLVLDTIKQLIP